MPKKTLCLFALLFILFTIASPTSAQDRTVFGPKDLTISWWRIHLSFHHFTVDDPGDGVILITKNTPEKRIRGGFLFFNGSLFSIGSFLVGTDTVYEKEVSLRSTNSLMVFLSGRPGASITIEVKKKSSVQPPEVTFSADPPTIILRESSTLTWTTTNVDSVTIDQGIGQVALSGSMNVSPSKTTTYTITAQGSGETVTASTQVVVIAPPEDVDYGLSTDEHQGGGGLVGKTIRILNGNTVEHRSELSFPSPHRLGLTVVATYNSKSHNQGSLGYGWTHTYAVSLDPAFVIGGKDFMKIIDHTGRAAYFEEQTAGISNGIFKERTSVKAEPGGYLWYRLDGTRYGFSHSGKLTWIEDAIRNRLELTYDAQDRLEKVSDTANGRMLTFHYTADGLVEHISGPITDAVPDGVWVTYEYDTNQNLTSVTYADGSGFSYTYTDPNDVHNLTEKRDKEDHLLATWSYDERDRCIDNFCVQGKGVSITYVSETQIEVTDAYGTLRTYTIGEVAGRKRVTALNGIGCPPYSESNIIRWLYDNSLNLIETESAGGTITLYQDYDKSGNPHTLRLAVGTPHECTISDTYHPDINVILSRTEASVLGSGNKQTVWDYDDDYDFFPNENPTGLLSHIIERGYTRNVSGTIVPFEYITTLTYNAKGQVMSIDGPLPGSDDTISFAYDTTTGDLLSITQPLIGSTTFSGYDAVGRVGRVTDVNGQSKRFAYDSKGRITAITNDADGSSSTISYDTAGQPTSVTDEDGVTRSYDYDGTYGRLITITDVEGNYIAYAYDTQDNRIEMSKHDPSGARTSRRRWSYEHPVIPGKLWKEINADDTFTEYGYDSEGNIASVKDPNGNTTYYAYDSLNRLSSVAEPGNVATTYTYDTHGNLTAVTDANGNTTTYDYDDMGRLVSTTSPDIGTVTYVYDTAGNPIQKTDAKGITVQYTYDLLNRLTAVHFPDPSEDITYSYDGGTYGKGRRTGMIDPSGSTTFDYDARGRLVEKTSTILGYSYTISTAYSPGSRVMSVTHPSGRTMDYTRDSMGRMEGLSTTYHASTVTLISNMTYNPFGVPKGLRTGSGGEINNQSGESGSIEVANPDEQMERTYTYDSNRNLIDIHAPNVPWYNQSFTYDALNSLISAQGRYGTISYTYDNVGNRLTRTVNGDTENCTYITGTNKLDQITGANPVSFTYDANGNISAIGSKILVYNQNNRLIKVEEGGSPLAEYTYNGLGQRVTKTVGGVTTIFHYDLNGKLIGESQPDGTMTAEYLYMGKIRIAKVDVNTGKIYYYLNDRLGTPQIMTDDSGTVVWEASYKPFGETEVNPNSTVVNDLRFPGQYYDQETGLYYNYFRYYDPRSGRYVRPDPSHTLHPEGVGIPYLFPFLLFSPEELNRYTYVVNNPIESSDPFGLARYFVFWQIKSVSAVVIPAGATKIKGTIVSTKRNRYGTYDAIDFEGIFFGSALGPLPLAGTLNNQEYFEDPCEQPDLTRIEGWSWYLAGSMALYKVGVSGGGYQFGTMRGVKETPSWAEGFDLGVDFMIGKIKTKGEVYQVTGDVLPAVGY